MADVNPRVDIAFKKIFGVEENKDLLISLINAVVSQEDQVKTVTLLNPYNQKRFKKDKLSILDIKAESTSGQKFNIEIQISDEADYDKRALYYWAKLYSDQLGEAQNYSKLNKVIGIHILNFTSIPKVEKYHNVFHIAEKELGHCYFKDLELHTIELKKFTDQLEKKHGKIVTKIQSALDMWSAFLTKHDLIDQEKLAKKLKSPELEKAIHVIGVMNFTKEEREAYENRLKWLRIEANTLKKVEARAKKEGQKIGEKKKATEIASALIAKGFSIEEASELTGLQEEEIKNGS
ncbi:Rpn family recombination-promoting nuclease/putative transposase [Candidatus Neptunochlamydia vexilliferae]|uniref:Transposase n=1 Tax=Candidatus Neptunichlamydia vexilliferae TaxID=1651774 RepID=A0ABS0B1C8_9BACT|nr:Rpn family recombination-promoting nuclease/putative transposase [Candidatus Neptunochlamydia vexilliferae]MBF5060177.1 hypothetical protein [Candidatus Neptunochlamydia vexilliferae]